jgi:hypothetical protein
MPGAWRQGAAGVPNMAVIQWLSDLPIGLSALLTIGGGILFAVLGTLVVNSYFTYAQLVFNNIVGGFEYAFLSSVYAGYIGLLLFGVHQKYDDVRADVYAEVSALTTLDRIAAAFPKATRDQVRKELRDYAQAVATVEWPRLKARRLNFETSATLDDLYYTYLAIEPQTERESAASQYSLQTLEIVRTNRAARIRLSLGALTPLLWAVAAAGTIISIVFPWFFGSPSVYSLMIMSSLVAIVTLSIFLVIIKLSYPFGGDHGIPPDLYLAFARSSSG